MKSTWTFFVNLPCRRSTHEQKWHRIPNESLHFGLSQVAGPTLERASLLHVCKITHQRPASSQTEVPIQGRFDLASTASATTSNDDDRYWYLRDPRWLGARPRLLGWNPLADLFALFPNLSRLEIALTQLTGPMLLRLIYQTQLSVLILTQVGT